MGHCLKNLLFSFKSRVWVFERFPNDDQFTSLQFTKTDNYSARQNRSINAVYGFLRITMKRHAAYPLAGLVGIGVRQLQACRTNPLDVTLCPSALREEKYLITDSEWATQVFIYDQFVVANAFSLDTSLAVPKLYFSIFPSQFLYV